MHAYFILSNHLRQDLICPGSFLGDILHSNPRALALVNSLVFGADTLIGRAPALPHSPGRCLGSLACRQWEPGLA